MPQPRAWRSQKQLYLSKSCAIHLFRIFCALTLINFFSAASCLGAGAPIEKSLKPEEIEYLKGIARDTYRSIDFFVEPRTGLPLDNSKFIKDAYTSVTNIGFYAASLAAACELGLEERSSAVYKLKKLFTSLAKLPKWKNFPHVWNNAAQLTSHPENFISTVDLANYYAGIIVARQYFPEIREECDRQLKVDWNDLYDTKKNLLYGGYNTEKNKYGDWYYNYFGSESRLASFLSIAMSSISVGSWAVLDRSLEVKHGIEYLKPGWMGGGLFLALMAEIFIDERGTLPGLSAGNFAKAQLVHMKKTGSPVWGWSASDSPKNGYLGWQKIMDEVVTPHASILAVSLFPKEVVGNLKKLESLGARPAYFYDGKYYDFGFRDAYDIKNKIVTENYLVLDQTMIFLALANFLKDRVIIRAFESYPPVKAAIPKIKEYASRSDAAVEFPVSLSKKGGVIKAVDTYAKPPEYRVVQAEKSPFNNPEEWMNASEVTLSSIHLETGNIQDDKDLSVNISFLWDPTFLYVRCDPIDQLLVLDYDGENIYKGDSIEIFVNPDNQGLVWGDPKDFQIGITPPDETGTHRTYAWFQKRKPAENELKVVSQPIQGGHSIIAALAWDFLKINNPQKGNRIGLSVAVNDIDADSFGAAKVNWFFKQMDNRVQLSMLTLQ